MCGFILYGFIAARGASKSNGFALRLVDIEGAQIESATLNINGNSYQKTVENNQTDAVVSLWCNSQTYTQTGEMGKCSLFKTNKQCAQFDPVSFSFDVKFTNSQLPLNHSALDFFIYSTAERTLEIHMPEYAPTDWFNSARFGTKQDTSVPSQQGYFKSASNLPWAIKTTDDWHYPREYIDVLWVYRDYEQWVETSGSQSADW